MPTEPAAGPDGQPHVVPVGFRYNPELDTIDIGGHDFAKRKKYRDVLRNPQVAFVVDDVASVSPWRVRGIEIRGTAEVLATGGEQVVPGFDPEMFRIRPRRIARWGLEGDPFGVNAPSPDLPRTVRCVRRERRGGRRYTCHSDRPRELSDPR